MGSRISIGLVYECNNMIESLEKLIKLLISDNGYIKGFKVSKDEEGNKWIENFDTTTSISDEVYSCLTLGFYGQINLVSDIINLKHKDIVLNIERHSDYYGFLIDIEESSLIDEDSIIDIATSIINLISDNFMNLRYDYAFCDNEAEIEYSLQEILSNNNDIYCLLFIPNFVENKIEVKKSNWLLDGLTKRT